MEALYNLSVMVSVIDRLTGPIKNMAQTFSDFENTIQRSKSIVDMGNRMAVSGTLISGSAASITGALGKITGPVIEVERSLGELASVGIKDLGALSRAAEEFSGIWAGTTEAQFISSAYDIKGGIESLSDTAVAQYTTIAAITAKATKDTTANMASLFATGYGIYKDMYSSMTDLEFGEMFSAGITAAAQMFKSDGPNMAQALTNLGAAATSANRPFEEQLAVLGMLQATMPGGEAATKYRAFMQATAKAGNALKLDFTDQNGQLLGIVDVLGILRSKFGDTLEAAEQLQIQKAFGSDEAVALINLLYPKIGQLDENIALLGQTMQQGTAYTAEIASAMNNDLGAQMELANQNVTILKRSIGAELSPLIKALIPTIRETATGFKDFAAAHPTLVRLSLLLLLLGAGLFSILGILLVATSGIVMFVGYFMMSIGQIGKGISWLKDAWPAVSNVGIKAFGILRPLLTGFLGILLRIGVFLTTGFVMAVGMAGQALMMAGRGILAFSRNAILAATRAIPALIGSVWSFTAALLANPITWIVLGIIALVAVIYLLWRNWDKVTLALGKGWDWILGKFNAGKQWLSGMFNGMIDGASQTFERLVPLVSTKITQVITAIQGRIAQFRSAGSALIQAFIDGLKSLIAKPAELVQQGLAKVAKLLPHSDAKEGPLSTLTASGAALMSTFAMGVASRSGVVKAATAAALAGVALTVPLVVMTPAMASNQLPIKPAVSSQAAITPAIDIMPEMPELSGQALINPVLGDMPRLPDITGQAFIDVARGAIPDLNGMGVDQLTQGGSLSIGPDVTPPNLKTFIRETTRERETTRIQDRRPVVIVMQSPAQTDNYEDVVNMALRQLEARG